MINDDAPKIYGLDQIRGGTPVYITEGPFDSTFIRNSIAMCASDGDVGKWGISTPIWVYDNGRATVKLLEESKTPSTEVRKLSYGHLISMKRI